MPPPAEPPPGGRADTPPEGSVRSRSSRQTQHDIQTTSQEIFAEKGLVPSEDQVERRVIMKRVGKVLKTAQSSDVWTKRLGIAALVLLVIGDDLRAWAKAHADMGWGLVGLGGILLTGAMAVARLRSTRDDDDGDGGGAPPAHS